MKVIKVDPHMAEKKVEEMGDRACFEARVIQFEQGRVIALFYSDSDTPTQCLHDAAARLESITV